MAPEVVLSAVGIDPAVAFEAGEAAVEETYAGAVLNGEGGQMSVRDEVPAQIAVNEKPSEDVAVAVPSVGHPGMVGVQPVSDAPPRVRWLQGIRGWVMMRWNAISDTHSNPTRSTPFIASSSHVRAKVWKWDCSLTA